ncbi:MAG: ABC transporter ATP-binding protein [candidate division WOR-3 bacterium]|nr:MAG: ABC transporter ATP-binding protein [candidate division WOR-3 bacterium]
MQILSCEHLTKMYKHRKQEVRAVDSISFEINRGEIVGLLGPNGAGKTTTIKCLCRLINPTAGKIMIDGKDVVRYPHFAFEKVAAVLEGNRNVYWRMSTIENLKLFAGLQGYSYKQVRNRIDELIGVFGLNDKINTEARFLSRGMQQKLAIACALIKNTDILLLDEPTLGLDVEMTHEVRNLLKQKISDEGKTILLSSHNMGVVEDVCQRVIIINHGKIVADEEITKIKEFFQVNTYTFEVEGEINQGIKEEFTQKFLGVKFSTDKTETHITVDLKDSMKIYEVLDILKQRNMKLLSIQNIEPDFEDIYLKLVRHEK